MTSRILAFGFIALLEFLIADGTSFASLPDLSEDPYANPAPRDRASIEIPGSFAADESASSPEPESTPIPSKPAAGKVTARIPDSKKASRP